MTTGRYQALQSYLADKAPSSAAVQLSFHEVEELICASLPRSAFVHRAWWSNQSDTSNRSQTKAWTEAGFEVDSVNQGKNPYVRFRRKSSRMEKRIMEPEQRLPDRPQQEFQRKVIVSTSVQRVFLVSCVKTKSLTPKPAEEFYTSDWFSKARRYVESTGSRWFVLSAKYGLVAPDTVLEPYEKTLKTMPVADRRRWAKGVFEDLLKVAPDLEAVTFLAGVTYREFLAGHLSQRGVAIEVPMEGLAFGQQLAWLGSGGPRGQA